LENQARNADHDLAEGTVFQMAERKDGIRKRIDSVNDGAQFRFD
jgi:hypothetical protein